MPLKEKKIPVVVTGPLRQKVKTYYGLLGDDKTAVIEMTKASRLEMVPKQKRNPLIITTYGTGELVKDALKQGVKKIVVGLGGSATNDGGAGMAQALGIHLLDKNNHELPIGGGALKQLSKIDTNNLIPQLKDCKIILASDVTNPLTGPNGASAVFGPQKGATKAMVKELDNNLHHYAKIINHDLHKNIEKLPGAGFMAFTNYEMHKGVEIAIKITKLADKVKNADYIFTGEGGTDF